MLAEMIRNPEMRRMLFNPEMMRMQLQMQRAMGGGGQRMQAPGVTDTTPQPNADGSATTPNAQSPAGSTPQQNPLAALLGGAGGAGGAGASPFGYLIGPQAGQQNQSNNTGSTSPPPANPFANLFGTPATAGSEGQPPNPIAEMTRQMMQNPESMQAAMNMLGGMGGGAGLGAGAGNATSPTGANPAANPFAALFGPGGFGGAGGLGSPAPQDNRPPEEVYEVQLRQLNEMGFYEFDRNVAALRRSGGNVQGAIEHLLGGGS